MMSSVFQIIQEYERAVIFRLGRIKAGGSQSPGLHFILPCIDKLTAIDLRTQVFDVVPQEVSLLTCKASLIIIILHQVLTKDSVTVSVDAVVYYRVSNATVSASSLNINKLIFLLSVVQVSVANVENAHHSTQLLAQTTLRTILGTKV